MSKLWWWLRSWRWQWCFLNRGLGRCWFTFRVCWEPQDLWVGVFWKGYPKAVELFVCVLPCFPIALYVQWNFPAHVRRLTES